MQHKKDTIKINKTIDDNTNIIVKQKYTYANIVEILDSIIRCSVLENVSIYNSVYSKNNKLIGYVNKVDDIYIEIITIIYSDIFKIGEQIYISQEPISIEFPKDIFNIVLDTFGKLIISNEKISIKNITNIKLPIKLKAPNITSRQVLNEQCITGINVIDLLYPIGHGQRMLLIGDKKTYKTSTVMEIIKNEHYNSLLLKNHKETIFIYVSTGQKKNDFISFINKVFDTTDVKIIAITATSSSPLGTQILAPDAAMSIADYYAKNNYRICVIIDDLLKQAIAIREQALLAHKLPGRESYPSDIFYAHSSLLERALNYVNNGSITCIPIIECIDNDLTGYIPTNLVSITDGQIFNSKYLMNNLLIPPISTELSVSRTGLSVQSPIFKKIGSFCKKTIAIYNKTLDFYLMYKDSCDNHIKQKIKNGLFINTILYNQMEINMHFINQIICTSLITNMKKILDIITLNNLENNNHYQLIKDIIYKAYQIIINDKKLIEKISIDKITDTTIQTIDNIVLINIDEELKNIKQNASI